MWTRQRIGWCLASVRALPYQSTTWGCSNRLYLAHVGWCPFRYSSRPSVDEYHDCFLPTSPLLLLFSLPSCFLVSLTSYFPFWERPSRRKKLPEGFSASQLALKLAEHNHVPPSCPTPPSRPRTTLCTPAAAATAIAFLVRCLLFYNPPPSPCLKKRKKKNKHQKTAFILLPSAKIPSRVKPTTNHVL